MRVGFFIVLVSGVLPFWTGCVATGENVSAKNQGLVVIGKQNQSEVERLLGKPTETFQEGNRLIYRYAGTQLRPYEAGLSSLGMHINSFDVLFENGVVLMTHGYQGSIVMKGSFSGRTTMGAEVTEESVQKVVEENSGLDQLKSWFGDPSSEALQVDGTVSRIWVMGIQKHSFSGAQVRRLVVNFDKQETVESYVLEDVDD